MHLANFSSVSKIYEAANENLKQVFAQLTPAAPADDVNTSIVQAYGYLKELWDLALQQHSGDLIIDQNDILHNINERLFMIGFPKEYDQQAILIYAAASEIQIAAIRAMYHQQSLGIAELREAATKTAAMCIKLIMNLPK
jgi:hypothetical protein